MKFAADGMLGKPTRWLRILGYDVKYSNRIDDDELIALSMKEKRILLTRDLQLYRRATAKGIETFYLEGETSEEKLAQLAKRYSMNIQIDMKKSRCPKCNALVKPVPREKLAETVEKSTFEHYSEFWQCSKCGQIYWQGAHWTRIKKSLETARTILQKQEKER